MWVVQDPAYEPIFLRMEAEVARLDAAAKDSPADRARRALEASHA